MKKILKWLKKWGGYILAGVCAVLGYRMLAKCRTGETFRTGQKKNELTDKEKEVVNEATAIRDRIAGLSDADINADIRAGLARFRKPGR